MIPVRFFSFVFPFSECSVIVSVPLPQLPRSRTAKAGLMEILLEEWILRPLLTLASVRPTAELYRLKRKIMDSPFTRKPPFDLLSFTRSWQCCWSILLRPYWHKVSRCHKRWCLLRVYKSCCSTFFLGSFVISWMFFCAQTTFGRHTTYGKVHWVFNLLHLYFMSPRTSKRTCHCSQAGVFQLYSSSVFSQISF